MKDLDRILEQDSDGMATYEYIVNNSDRCACDLPCLIDKLKHVDMTGQFLASAARFLHAVDPEKYADFMTPLIEGAIEKDKERKYIGSLLQALWGDNYEERVDELNKNDDNFRRIYKRVNPRGI